MRRMINQTLIDYIKALHENIEIADDGIILRNKYLNIFYSGGAGGIYIINEDEEAEVDITVSEYDGDSTLLIDKPIKPAGIVDTNASRGTAEQVLTSTGDEVEWKTPNQYSDGDSLRIYYNGSIWKMDGVHTADFPTGFYLMNVSLGEESNGFQNVLCFMRSYNNVGTTTKEITLSNYDTLDTEGIGFIRVGLTGEENIGIDLGGTFAQTTLSEGDEILLFPIRNR